MAGFDETKHPRGGAGNAGQFRTKVNDAPTGTLEPAAAPRPRGCACAHNRDGSTTTMLCPVHADQDPCLTMSQVTGRRRKGSIVRGRCSSCGHTER